MGHMVSPRVCTSIKYVWGDDNNVVPVLLFEFGVDRDSKR